MPDDSEPAKPGPPEMAGVPSQTPASSAQVHTKRTTHHCGVVTFKPGVVFPLPPCCAAIWDLVGPGTGDTTRVVLCPQPSHSPPRPLSPQHAVSSVIRVHAIKILPGQFFYPHDTCLRTLTLRSLELETGATNVKTLTTEELADSN